MRAQKYERRIALIPSLRNEVGTKRYHRIHDFMQKMAALSDASFIMIQNNGKAPFRSVFADKWATLKVGNDNEAVLREKHDNHP